MWLVSFEDSAWSKCRKDSKLNSTGNLKVVVNKPVTVNWRCSCLNWCMHLLSQVLASSEKWAITYRSMAGHDGRTAIVNINMHIIGQCMCGSLIFSVWRIFSCCFGALNTMLVTSLLHSNLPIAEMTFRNQSFKLAMSPFSSLHVTSVHVPSGPGKVLWRHCDTSCTSGFVTFPQDAHSLYCISTLGQSLMSIQSMTALLIL